MELRAKRATSPLTQDSIISRRRTLDHPACSRKEAMLSGLQIQPSSDNGAGYLSFPGKFRLLVKGDQWLSWSQDTSRIPMYILNEMNRDPPKSRADNKIEEMELTEEVFRAGDNFVVDEIEKDGAEMLVTKFGQSEIFFGVTGRDIKCAGNKFAMIGRPYDHAQYIGWLPQGLFKEQVLDHFAFDGYGKQYKTKERVLYRETLKEITDCSCMVYSREVKQDDPQTLSCVRVPARVAETQKLPAHLMLGMGFETKSGYRCVITIGLFKRIRFL
jgi:hypothetical protein